jgi:amino acid transporter
VNNVGALASWGVAGVLLALGAVAFTTGGSATVFTASSLLPSLSLKNVIFWSTMAFAYGGIESGSMMAEEIADARRTVPRAALTAAASIALLYLAGTLAILVSVPSEGISGLQGIMQALAAASARVGVPGAMPVLALLVTISSIGGVGGWFAAVARLPFAAGLDRFLPEAFGRLHPRWRTPHVALLTQASISAVFVLLGQAGTSVRGAYDVFVSMSIITYFVPFLFMFAALVRVQRRPAGAGVVRAPGGRWTATILGILGFATTALSIVLACVPSDDDPHPVLAVAKIVGSSAVLAGIGVALYIRGRRGARP